MPRALAIVVPHANKTLGQDVKKPAPDEIEWIERLALSFHRRCPDS